MSPAPDAPTPAPDAAAPDAAAPDAATPGAATSASGVRPSRRRLFWSRVVLYGLVVPWALYNMLAAYVRLTRLPDLENDLSALLPREGTLLYAELPSPKDLLPAIRATHTMRAFTGTDERGRPVAPLPVPGDDERSLRRADRRARMFRTMTSVMPAIFDQPVVYAIVRWPGEPTVVQYFLTRSEPTVARQVMPMIGLLMPGMTTTNAVHRDVPHTMMVKHDEEDGDDAMQFVQLGDVFAVVFDSDDPAHAERLIEAWFRNDRRRSHYAEVVAARRLVEEAWPAEEARGAASGAAAGAGAAGREWFFATIEAEGFVAAARDVAEGHLAAGDENDALDWIGYAEWVERLGSASLVARERAGGGLEIAGVFAPPGRLTPASAKDAGAPTGGGTAAAHEDATFAFRATSARAAGWLLHLVLPGEAAHADAKREATTRLAAMKKRAAGGGGDAGAPADTPLAFEARGGVAPPRLAGTVVGTSGGGSPLAGLRQALAAERLAAGEHFRSTASHVAFAWPAEDAPQPSATADGAAGEAAARAGRASAPLPGDLLAHAIVAAGGLDDDAFHAFALALTSDTERARTRRSAIQFLTFLHDAASWELRASLLRGGRVLAVLSSEPLPAAP